jgi:hypothetical protein
MLVPNMPAGIEEADGTAQNVHGCDIGAFVPIAEDTGVGKIAGVRGTAVFSADDVIDLMGEPGAIFMHQAVFAPSVCAFYDKTARGFVYLMSHWRESAGREPSPGGGCAPGP